MTPIYLVTLQTRLSVHLLLFYYTFTILPLYTFNGGLETPSFVDWTRSEASHSLERNVSVLFFISFYPVLFYFSTRSGGPSLLVLHFRILVASCYLQYPPYCLVTVPYSPYISLFQLKLHNTLMKFII